MPKNEGGLGFRSLKKWNKASNMRQLWALSKKADSLLVKWVHTYVMKGHSLWGDADSKLCLLGSEENLKLKREMPIYD